MANQGTQVGTEGDASAIFTTASPLLTMTPMNHVPAKLTVSAIMYPIYHHSPCLTETSKQNAWLYTHISGSSQDGRVLVSHQVLYNASPSAHSIAS